MILRGLDALEYIIYNRSQLFARCALIDYVSNKMSYNIIIDDKTGWYVVDVPFNIKALSFINHTYKIT